jgi:hypothetical protein
MLCSSHISLHFLQPGHKQNPIFKSPLPLGKAVRMSSVQWIVSRCGTFLLAEVAQN